MFKSKTVIVTGGSRGIGAACAKKFAKEGADVAILAAHDSDKARETLKEVSEFGNQAELYICDVSDMDAVKETVDTIVFVVIAAIIATTIYLVKFLIY